MDKVSARVRQRAACALFLASTIAANLSSHASETENELKFICPALSELLEDASAIATTTVVSIVHSGVLSGERGRLVDSPTGDIAYVITSERPLKTYRWFGDKPPPAEIRVLSASACPGCKRRNAVEVSPIVGTDRLLLAQRPSDPGVLNIPEIVRGMGLQFDAVGGSACAYVGIDTNGESEEVEKTLGLIGK